jgi:hypothetical protein
MTKFCTLLKILIHKVIADKKVEDEVNNEKDENFNLDDCSIDLGAD